MKCYQDRKCCTGDKILPMVDNITIKIEKADWKVLMNILTFPSEWGKIFILVDFLMREKLIYQVFHLGTECNRIFSTTTE